jgi:hypothetical protein
MIATNQTNNKNVSSLLNILLFAVAWFILEYVVAGVLALSVIFLFVGGFVLWWFTTRRVPIDPHAIIIPYLTMIIAFIAHVYEEWQAFIRGYRHIMEGLPFFPPLTQEILLPPSIFMGTSLWLVGAVLLLKRWSVGYFAASAFLFGMMFIEPTHYLAPFLQSGPIHYVGGLWTAFMPISLGWYIFFRIRREMGKTVASPGIAR